MQSSYEPPEFPPNPVAIHRCVYECRSSTATAATKTTTTTTRVPVPVPVPVPAQYPEKKNQKKVRRRLIVPRPHAHRGLRLISVGRRTRINWAPRPHVRLRPKGAWRVLDGSRPVLSYARAIATDESSRAAQRADRSTGVRAPPDSKVVMHTG